jgi:CheY-like chemotaxis protein
MIELRTHFAPDLPPVCADATQLHQIVVNLATNAAQAIGGGNGWIEFRLDVAALSEELVTAAASLRPGCYVRLVVTDNGCGMNQTTLERVFDPFFTTKRHGQGTGLGLSVVHGIVQSHGGGILVDTQPGKGSTFYLYLPAAEVPASPCAPDESAAEQPRASQVRCVRILYVDDEEPLVFLAKRKLQRIGHVVTGHTDAAQALEEFCSRPGDFDVVVTDLSMPGMSGFDFARGVLAVRPDMPILMTSGYVRPEDREAAEQMGIRNLMLKPGTLEDMVVLLDRMISSSRPLASATPESP